MKLVMSVLLGYLLLGGAMFFLNNDVRTIKCEYFKPVTESLDITLPKIQTRRVELAEKRLQIEVLPVAVNKNVVGKTAKLPSPLIRIRLFRGTRNERVLSDVYDVRDPYNQQRLERALKQIVNDKTIPVVLRIDETTMFKHYANLVVTLDKLNLKNVIVAARSISTR